MRLDAEEPSGYIKIPKSLPANRFRWGRVISIGIRDRFLGVYFERRYSDPRRALILVSSSVH